MYVVRVKGHMAQLGPMEIPFHNDGKTQIVRRETTQRESRMKKLINSLSRSLKG
jgi:hypothetical protein